MEGPWAAFDRKELIAIRERAEGLAGPGTVELWRRAFLALADAADHLDGMLARCDVSEPSFLPSVADPTSKPEEGRFLKALTNPGEPNHRFFVCEGEGGFVVASVNLTIEDWAAYRGQGDDWWQVRTLGTKLPASEAAKLFPSLAAHFSYRT